MGNFKILIVEDDIYSLENIQLSLKDKPYKVHKALDSKEAEEILMSEKFDLLITDYRLPCKDGLLLAEQAINDGNVNNAILITGYSDENAIERALKIGVKDFIRKPYKENELLNSIHKIYERHLLKQENEELKKKLKIENRILRQQLLQDEEKCNIIGEDTKLNIVLKRAKQIALYSESTLIQGESGTGKELLARFIHYNGARKTMPFIAVNAASLSPSLFESEIFGHNKGAFTGATENKPGLFEIANGGILFLDEISEIPLQLQAKLLRVLETGKIRRIGDNKWNTVDVQIIATTNRSENELLLGKILRKDLFHRLTSSILTLPPLRERKSDIPLLIKYYFEKYSAKYEKHVNPPSKELLQKLIRFDWPGNIRQLSNFTKNYVLFEENLTEDEIDHWLSNGVLLQEEDELSFKFINGTIDELEEAKLWLIRKILIKYGYNKAQTAKHLGMSYPGLHAIIKRYDLM